MICKHISFLVTIKISTLPTSTSEKCFPSFSFHPSGKERHWVEIETDPSQNVHFTLLLHFCCLASDDHNDPRWKRWLILKLKTSSLFAHVNLQQSLFFFYALETIWCHSATSFSIPDSCQSWVNLPTLPFTSTLGERVEDEPIFHRVNWRTVVGPWSWYVSPAGGGGLN